ncbi:MAG: hypothetical protein HYY02_11475 [Chloroflexi bacterium]|nr:hypothetical protein [Chloroflexota bacterium]
MPSASDYWQRLRQRLLLDADDPIFAGPLFVGEAGNARKKLTDLVSSRSDDAVLWSVFRTLARLPSAIWLPPLLSQFATPFTGAPAPLRLEFWKRVPPPTNRLLWLLDHLETLRPDLPGRDPALAQRLERVAKNLARWRAAVDEGPPERGEGILEPPVELDLLLTTPELLVVVLGRYLGDVATATPWDARRDMIARNMDAALELADESSAPYFLLISDDFVHEGPETPPKAYEALMTRYRDEPEFLAGRLPYRTAAEVRRLVGRIAWTTWADLLDLVLDHSAGFSPPQKEILRRLVDYLKDKRLLHKGG